MNHSLNVLTTFPTFDATRRAIEAGETTVEKVTAECLSIVEQRKQLNAFLTVFGGRALDQAREVDKKLGNGTAGPLAGMVIAVKDVLCVANERVTCGSRFLGEFISPYDATVIERLRGVQDVASR